MEGREFGRRASVVVADWPRAELMRVARKRVGKVERHHGLIVAGEGLLAFSGSDAIIGSWMKSKFLMEQ